MGIKRSLLIVCAFASVSLLCLNLYGEATTMRIIDQVPVSGLKFENDVTLNIDETLEQIQKRKNENDLQFAIRITEVVQKSLGHVEDWETQPPDLYAQRVPIKENLWLHLAGRLSSEPQVQRYHFADYRKTLERGIGICGDTSTMLSEILWDNNIPNSILAFDGHVVVEARPKNHPPHILDADYGAYYEINADTSSEYADIFSQYKSAGYDDDIAANISTILAGDYTAYSNTFDFMKKRYVMEKTLYLFKWLLPLTLLIISVLPTLLRRFKISSGRYHPVTI